MDAGSQSNEAMPQALCPSCGLAVAADAAFCPNCGRAIYATPPTPTASFAAASSALTAPDAFDAPTVVGASESIATSGANWPGLQLPAATGMTSLGAGATLTPAHPVRSHRLRTLTAVVSTLVVLALIGGSSFWLYTAFASSSEQVTAKLVPQNTILFASVDLTAAANNNHKLTLDDLAQAVGVDSIVTASHLNWNTDIKPWLGRYIAIAAFPDGTARGTPSVTSPTAFGEALIIQSRDTSAAQAAVSKAAHAQHGASVSSSSYHGYTLCQMGPASDTARPALAVGNGWVIAASSTAAAQAVIDRATGASSDALSGSPSFQDAVSNLPSNRFGTLYVNIRAYVDALIAAAPGATQAALNVPFADTYPVAGGDLVWTDTGLRAQLTLNAVKSASIPNLAGDTSGLASFVPTGALSYVSVANMGALVRAAYSQVPAAASATAGDPLQKTYGVSSSDPALQQPAAMATFALPGATASQPGTASVTLLRAPDTTATQTLFKKIATKSNWTLKATTVDGIAATEAYATGYTYTPPVTPPTKGTSKPGIAKQPTPKPQQYLAGVAATVNGVFVFASSTAALDAVIQVTRGTASLGQSADFQQLIGQAPGNSALVEYTNLAASRALAQQHAPKGARTPTATALMNRVKAMLLTFTWSAQQNQTTVDIKIV